MRTLVHIFWVMYITIGCMAYSGHALGQDTARPLTIGLTDTFRSRLLDETRTINIYLPDGYATDTAHYPLILVLDGGIQEDFLSIVGIARYSSQPWVDRIPASIVVGIENINRRKDFTFPVNDLGFLDAMGYDKKNFPFYGGSEKYIRFLDEELMPYLEAKYRTAPDRTLIGESLAGLLATEILVERPHMFGRYIIISPSLWWGGGSLITKANESLGPLHATSVYLGVPNKDEDKTMYDMAGDLHKAFSKHRDLHVVYDYLADETHATVLYQAVYNAFKKMSATH